MFTIVIITKTVSEKIYSPIKLDRNYIFHVLVKLILNLLIVIDFFTKNNIIYLKFKRIEVF